VGSGPFAGQDLLAKMVILQAFNGTVALTALLLSAVITERNQTLQALQDACDDLTEALTQLAPDRHLTTRPLRPDPTPARTNGGPAHRTSDDA
jgi:hypothetical protein